MKNIYDLIIIGGGPAGVTAGIYAARKCLKTLLLTRDFVGQVAKTSRVDNWPGEFGISGLDLAKKFEKHLKEFTRPAGCAAGRCAAGRPAPCPAAEGGGAGGEGREGREGSEDSGPGIEVQEGEEVVKVTTFGRGASRRGATSGAGRGTCRGATTAKEKFLVKTESGKEFVARAVIVATGADPRPLEVPGEKEFIGRGVSYCSVCDSPFFTGKAVAVIGGGNSGFEAALDLAPYAKKIFIFERSSRVLADEILQEQVARTGKVEVLLNKELKKIEGSGAAPSRRGAAPSRRGSAAARGGKPGTVQAIVYKDLKTGKTFQQPIGGVFVQIGSIPATGFLKGLVDFNEKDEIKVDFKTCATSCPGLFAAGDVNDGKWKQIVVAAGEGCRAALAAYEYLQGLQS